MNQLQLLKAFVKNNLRGGPLSVGWILCGDETIGSSRIQGINLHKGLIDSGINSFLLSTPNSFVERLEMNRIEKTLLVNGNFDIVIFQRVYGKNAVNLCSKLRRKRTLCGFYMADIYANDMLYEVDFIIVSSEYLRQHIISAGINPEKVFFLPDAVETEPFFKKDYSGIEQIKNSKIKVVLVGNAGHWPAMDHMKELFNNNPDLENMELIVISNHPEADIQWQLNRVWNDIISCDIGLVPVDFNNPRSLAKSNNRVTMFMGMAMPVICSPIHSYVNLIKHGKNGFLATMDSQWVNHLHELKEPSLRKSIGETSYHYAHSEFSRKNITSQLIAIFEKMRDVKSYSN